jgi:hypothetical protein
MTSGLDKGSVDVNADAGHELALAADCEAADGVGE